MSETPLLDAMLAEAEGRLSISELRTPVNYTENLLETYPPTKTNTGDCMWSPCTYILFGQVGESHADYHKRKGRC